MKIKHRVIFAVVCLFTVSCSNSQKKKILSDYNTLLTAKTTNPILQNSDVTGYGIALGYSVNNPTKDEALLKSITWKTYLNRKPVAEQSLVLQTLVESGDYIDGSIHIHIPDPFVPSNLNSELHSEFLSYTIDGAIIIEHDGDEVRFPFRQNGAVNGHMLPSIDVAVSAIRFVKEERRQRWRKKKKHKNYDGIVELHFELDISNPNPYPITLQHVKYQCSIEGEQAIYVEENYKENIAAGVNKKYRSVRLVGKEDFHSLAKKLINAPRIGYESRGFIQIEGHQLPFGNIGDLVFKESQWED